MAAETLEDHSANFALEIQATLDAVLPGERRIVSRRVEGAERYIVQPEGSSTVSRRVPVYVNDAHLANLAVALYLDMDRTGRYLKTLASSIGVYSVLDRMPLVRLEYLADMHSAPIAHWQFHAERGAFSHLLARAHADRPKLVAKPHDLSSLHLPVGGERFRPCLEDVLEFLVRDCGADHLDGWEAALRAGRERWRRRQLASAVRDVPGEAARVLRELGWTVTEPELFTVSEKTASLTTW